MAAFAEERGLVCESKRMYGKFNGYQISIRFDSTMMYVGFHINAGTKTSELTSFLTITRKKDLHIMQTAIDGSGVYCVFMNMTLGGSLKKADLALREVTEYLKVLEIPADSCPYCGLPMETAVTVEDNYCKFEAHEQCFGNKFSQVMAAEQEENLAPNNYLNGFAGALIGALVGCGIFAILFVAGYLASLSSLLGALLASVLYSKFGGKNNKVKIVIVTLTTFILIIATFFICNIVYVSHLMKEEGLYGSAIKVLFTLIKENEEVRRAFIGDLVLTIMFTILGIVLNVITMVRQQKKVSSSMKKY